MFESHTRAEEALSADDAGAASVVHLRGALDADDVAVFNRLMADVVERRHRPALLDLSGATLLESRMLGAILGWRRHAEETGRGPVVVVAPDRSSTALRLLETVAQDILPVYAGVDEALAALAG